jgi:ribonuclease-3
MYTPGLPGTIMSESSKGTERGADGTALETMLGYRFRNGALLVRALTHRSYVNEREGQGLQHNESLEFLGDAVLGFLVSARIFGRFPNLAEGELSKAKAYLVSAANLARLAESTGLGEHLRLGRGEDKTGGRHKRAILADAFEALLAAIYLDGGVEAAADFIERQLGPSLEDLDPDQPYYGDFKSALQEQLHDLGQSEPSYKVVDEIGPDHRKTFVVQVLVAGQVVASASGKSKKEAQQEAARLALNEFKGRPQHPSPGGI